MLSFFTIFEQRLVLKPIIRETDFRKAQLKLVELKI